MLADKLTHTSVSATKQLIGRSEFIDWLAYYQIKREEEIKASKKK